MGSQKVSFVAALGLSYSSSQYSPILSAVAFAIIGFVCTNALIPRVGDSFIKIGSFGKDMSKPGKPVIPETIGSVAAVVYSFVMMFFIPFIFYRYMVIGTSGGGHRDVAREETARESFFPHNKLSEYLSAILCLESQVMSGVADDLFDLRWRHKFFLPAVAAIPLSIVYYVDFGVTYVLVPQFLQKYVHFTSIDSGASYYIYMSAMGIFCPNSINISAGINGLEVGQCIVSAISTLLNDAIYLTVGAEASKEAHRFSTVLILPFLGVSLALYRWNKWPAKVFVGDTYCYFAGMVFAVVGILGHFSKTMLSLFLPQIVNFLYSCPQLFNIVFCPRHRLPRFNESDGLLYPSRADLKENPPKGFFVPVSRLLHVLHLIDLEFDKDNNIVSCSNMTMINLLLVWFGPLREDKLCNRILIIQFMFGLCALTARHAVGTSSFGNDNLSSIRLQ